MRTAFTIAGVALLALLGSTGVAAQEATIRPDLKALAQGKAGPLPAGATVAWVGDAKGRTALKIQSRTDDTVILLPGMELGNGVIEFDALGQSNPPQSSFLGIAFRVVDARTHDVVYFRPFNFRAATPDRQAHSVQYVSLPAYGWAVLRETRPGQYEQPIVPAPDGDAWFHVRIVVQKPMVRVYVGDAEQPSLTVKELSDRHGGGVGLWVGPGEGGYLANLKITPSN